ncbi:MAG: hypothetical protein IJR14_07075 [Synergistaceae bacterium]|nr:hypothetical protein [Synergistaceae bacterium]
MEAGEAKARRMSAELNGATGCYLHDGGRLADAEGDMHSFIHTDTWQGQSAAEMILDWEERRASG